MPADLPPDFADYPSRIAAGDTTAFEAVFELYYEPLRRYAQRLLESREEAEDTVHDVFLRIWDRRAELAAVGDLGSYLYTSTRHTAINRLRRRRVESQSRERLTAAAERDATALTPEAEQLLADRELAATLQRAIDTLPPRQREVILLRWQQRSYDEIAQQLGISPKTVAAHLARALEHLRATLAHLL